MTTARPFSALPARHRRTSSTSGDGTGLAPAILRDALLDTPGLGLMRHASTEFTFLAPFLPSLYLAEHHEREGLHDAW